MLCKGTSEERQHLRLLSLTANSPLYIRLCSGSKEMDEAIEKSVAQDDCPYRILVSDRHSSFSLYQLNIDPWSIETSIGMQYMGNSAYSDTKLIVYSFWPIGYSVIKNILQKPWKSVEIYAVRFGIYIK